MLNSITEFYISINHAQFFLRIFPYLTLICYTSICLCTYRMSDMFTNYFPKLLFDAACRQNEINVKNRTHNKPKILKILQHLNGKHVGKSLSMHQSNKIMEINRVCMSFCVFMQKDIAYVLQSFHSCQKRVEFESARLKHILSVNMIDKREALVIKCIYL